MVKYVDFGGEPRPVKFGFAALMNFTDMSGYKLNDLDKLGENMTLSDAVKLIYCGLKTGARVEKKKFNSSLEDVADWLDDNQNTLQEVLNIFAESFSAPSEEGE